MSDAVDLSILLQCLQEERAAVAITIFLNRPATVDSIQDLQQYVSNGLDITRFTLSKVNYVNVVDNNKHILTIIYVKNNNLK